jgi:GT2 family glycosyltransferase
MRQRPQVSFVIPVKNDAARLRRCLMSIQRNPGASDIAEILVVDNGSTDGSALVAFEAGAKVLKCPGLAVSALRNEAAARATGELLALVDADHEIDAGWLASAIEAMQRPGVGAAGAPYNSPPNGTWVQRAYDGLRSRSLQPCDAAWLGSGNLVVRRDVFVELGGFDTTLDTCEDVDFCNRLRERGYRLISDGRLRSVHFGDPATLAALFRSELWRGRDNLKASLRGKITPRDVPSVAIPFLDLLLLITAAISVATLSRSGLMAGATAMGMVFALASIRTGVMMRRLHRAPLGGFDVFVVAVVYDAARALALVARAGHEMRKRA